MDEAGVTIYGIEETVQALDALPQKVVKNAFARALTAGAVPIAAELELRAPKDTGDMVEHLTTDVAIDASGKGGVAQVGFGKAGWKARLVEFGHRMVGHAPKKEEVGIVVPHPFMRPAAAAAADKSVEAFAESLRESVEKGL